jgi:hypothetical protein
MLKRVEEEVESRRRKWGSQRKEMTEWGRWR